MKSLGARLALLLVTAIVLVVITSSFAAFLVMRGPRPEETMDPVAKQMHMLANIAEHNREEAVSQGMVIADAPASGQRDERFSDFLTKALNRTGEPQEAFVTRLEPNTAMASIKLADGQWLLVPMPNFGPPPGGWQILTAWLSLIIAGSIFISAVAASKIIKPLRLLEKALGDIGPDGTLPHVPETGPGEIRVTAKALNRLSARVKTATESRMRLVAAAGHDLRTPMTRMRLRAEFILNDSERRKWLSDLEELDQIADSAIGLVREEVNRDGVQDVRLDLAIANIVAELGEIGVSVATGALQHATVRVGPLAVTRALRNLLINAATHGEAATVSVSEADGNAIVEILDTGPGIPEERLSQVFEPFFRIDIARQKSLPGAGLGMAIAKEIISRFDGAITVCNRPTGGLEQIITFRVASADESRR